MSYQDFVDLPASGTPVMVKLANGQRLEAMIIATVGHDGQGTWSWAATHGCGSNYPDNWTDGICWAENEDGLPSTPVVSWKPIAENPARAD